jgi:hypothetical protein
LAAAALGGILAVMPTVVSAAATDYTDRAETDFETFVSETYPDSEISPGPHCSVNEDFYVTADCEALVDGEHVAYIGRWNEFRDPEGFDNWQTPEAIAAEDAAADAFVTWAKDKYGLDFGEEDETIYGWPSCSVTDTEGFCGGTAADGRDISAEVTITPNGYEFTSEFVDVAAIDTPIADAIDTCVTEGDSDLSYSTYDGYEILDEGHSAVAHSSDAFDCLREGLGWPDWISEQVSFEIELWQTIPFDGYTITWDEGRAIVYDQTVSGTE